MVWFLILFFQYKYFLSKKLTAKNDETALRELREPFMHDFSTQWSTNGKLVVWVGGLGFESGFPPQLHSLSYGDPIGIQTSYPPKPASGETPKKSPDIKPTTPPGERKRAMHLDNETNLKNTEERPTSKTYAGVERCFTSGARPKETVTKSRWNIPSQRQLKE